MTRNLTLIKSLAVAGVAGLLLSGCGGGGDNPPAGNTDGGEDSSTGGSTAGSSFSVMESWEGCEALDDIQPIQDYMAVSDLGSSGLVTSKIGAGLDGEAFTCGAMADIAPLEKDGREFPGNATITVGGVPWNSEEEATENFQSRVTQLLDSIETDGTERTNVKEGELEGDWDESYLYTGQDTTSWYINAIGRKGDLVVYTFLNYTEDPGVMFDAEPTYPFTHEEIIPWVANDYMSQTLTDLLAKKESGL
ncbi:hypothetical protein [Glycomyces tritici]|uniref:Lipoprotein n=1 Tax=Glycomyces tritici TaxID=2665176 RepID=A0ABT7YXF7_9ACTN|nr:hypothetical protein [Glycomyces tritici]MDN3241288.1 hypothetical protein [Glycomyces tritici]MDN3243311.1 hypothetical protein [Glycomyces tritici]